MPNKNIMTPEERAAYRHEQFLIRQHEDWLRDIADKFCELFSYYSQEPIAIDRLDPTCRVGFSELVSLFPSLRITDRPDLQPYINRAMRRRGLSFKKRSNNA